MKMAIDLVVEEREMVIDQDYLKKHGANLKSLKKALELDLKSIGRIIIRPPIDPSFNPLYSDVLSYVCGRAFSGKFLIIPTNEYDERKIKLFSGRRLIKEGEGYRFKG